MQQIAVEPVRSLARDMRLKAAKIEQLAREAQHRGSDDIQNHSYTHVMMQRHAGELRAMLDVMFARIGKADR